MNYEDVTSQWEQARLFSTHGISQGKEAENRVTSALLSVVKAVPDFLNYLLPPIGIAKFPKINLQNVSTYYQPTLVLSSNEKVRPDGAIVINGRGGNTLSVLLEVKTDKDILEEEQISKYLEVAQKENFTHVFTISNQISFMKRSHPLNKNKLPNNNVELIHLSWAYIKSRAVVYNEYINVEDREQKWIIEEFIRYMESPTTYVSDFGGMGQYWNIALEKIQSKTINSSNYEIHDAISKILSLVSYSALQLEERTGVEIDPIYSKDLSNENEKIIDSKIKELSETGDFVTSYRINNSYSDLKVEIKFSSHEIVCSVELPANDNRTNKQKASWFLKQLQKHDFPIRIKAKMKHSRGNDIAILSSDIKDTSELFQEGKTIEKFKMSVRFPMGTRPTANARGSFITSYISALAEAYELFLVGFKPYEENLPIVRREPTKQAVEATKQFPKKEQPWPNVLISPIQGPPPIIKGH